MRRYGLRDDQWDRIKDFLPGREGHVGALRWPEEMPERGRATLSDEVIIDFKQKLN